MLPKIQASDLVIRTGMEDHDIMLENEETSQEEAEVWEENDDLIQLLQVPMERFMTTVKEGIEKRERMTEVKLIEEIKQGPT